MEIMGEVGLEARMDRRRRNFHAATQNRVHF